MTSEYQNYCNANYGPEDEPTREEQEGDAWEYWHQRAQRLAAALYEIGEKEPGTCVFGDPPQLSAEEANKLLSDIFIIARVATAAR